jgi:predicted phosphodiesterase
MSAIFIHLSDIHFGQERDHRVHIHADVKEQLLSDAGEVVRGLAGGIAHGILVTGDVAYSGKREQYEDAAKWLDALAEKVGCPIHRVQMVPGNHDLDRDKLSLGASYLLGLIRGGGAAEYEQVLSNKSDRSALFSRFEEFGRFSFGYRCALDEEGKYATNLHVELAPGRSIRFIRMNSSLLCTGSEDDKNPELMIGARQFIVPRKVGEENIVLVHHPLNWYKDGNDVRNYIRSRARIFISGHEHNPKVEIHHVGEGCDIMMLAAGATVPFKSDETYTFTYNIIEFDWDVENDALAVTMHPRAWNPTDTCFEADDKRLGGKEPRFTLGSPNFRKAQGPSTAADPLGPDLGTEATPLEVAGPVVELVATEAPEGEATTMPPNVEGYELAMLRFFRDLLENERLRILVALDAIPSDSDERMTQGVERKLFDWLAREGRLPDVVRMIGEVISERKDGGA